MESHRKNTSIASQKLDLGHALGDSSSRPGPALSRIIHPMTHQSSRLMRALIAASQPFQAAIVSAALACIVTATVPALAQSPDASDWGYYGGDSFGQRFSSLDEINRKNVTHLTVAWIYRTGENGAGFARASKLSFEATPVLGFGLLYVETPTNIIIALDPETGVQRWRYDPHIDRSRPYAEVSSRGVSIWEDS